MNRRSFVTRSLASVMAAPILGVGYGACEATWLRVDRQTIAVPYLPSAFQGKTVGVLADPHHSQFVTLDYIQSRRRSAQRPEAGPGPVAW